jgi:hypothetical protein
MIALLLQFAATSKQLDILQDPDSSEAKLVFRLLDMCFAMLPRLQVVDVQKAQQLAQLGIPLAERVLLPFILEVTRGLQSGLAWAGKGREVK